MPARNTPLVTNHYYHVFNRSLARMPIFSYKSDYYRALDLLYYYNFKNPPYSLSKLKKADRKIRENIYQELEKKANCLVKIIAYCLMPNHYHLLIKQVQENGIMLFIRNFQNGYAKYFNLKNERRGSLFESRFKAVLIEDDNQLLHLSRYIHLNPYSSFLVKTKKALLEYCWSSLPVYLKKSTGFCQPDIILGQFKNRKDYLNFVFDQADYQRNLERIKHLTCE